MIALQEVVWRQALQVRGKDWVARELATHPGQPDDVLLDVVFEDPLPTREFCRKWCTEEDNRMFTFSARTIVAALFVGIIAASLTMAVISLQKDTSTTTHRSVQ
jgi:hypothetical protein